MELIYAIAAEPIALGQLVRPLVSEAPDESADEEPLRVVPVDLNDPSSIAGVIGFAMNDARIGQKVRVLASLTTARLFGYGL
jgi:hypothetical protein